MKITIEIRRRETGNWEEDVARIKRYTRLLNEIKRECDPQSECTLLITETD